MNTTGSYGPHRTMRTKVVAIGISGLLVAMLLGQLYSYEDYAVILGALLPVTGSAQLRFVAAAIVLVELLALPYLLGMYLSKLMRVICGSFAAAVSVFWLFTSFTNSHASNSGLFSTAIELPGGLLATAVALLLFAGTVIVIRADVGTAAHPLEKKH